VSSVAYVRNFEFRDGIADFMAGRPLPDFDSSWAYEDGRIFAAALCQRGIDPRRLSIAQLCKLLLMLERDGTVLPNARRT
jgi:hypothetical protein